MTKMAATVTNNKGDETIRTRYLRTTVFVVHVYRPKFVFSRQSKEHIQLIKACMSHA